MIQELVADRQIRHAETESPATAGLGFKACAVRLQITENHLKLDPFIGMRGAMIKVG